MANDEKDMHAEIAAIRALHEEAERLVAALKEKLSELDTAKATFSEATVASQIKVSEVAEIATAALAAKTQIADAQGVIASKSDHIQKAQEHADKVRAELDRIQTAANQSATEAEGLRAKADAASNTAAEILAAIRAHKATADAELAATNAARDSAKTAAEATKSLADKAMTIEQKITAYETRLAELEAQSSAQLGTITGLLPGATAAGLAHAFDDRRETFLKPASNWQNWFVFSLVALTALAAQGLYTVSTQSSIPDWDDLARLWVARLPIGAALVWLALHASHEAALAKRLEEDYGYKAAIATSFQGFQKQMAEIGATTATESPLSKLCNDTLTTLASPPGRIYDKHQLTATPTKELVKELASLATQAADQVKKATS